jgi:hypothetical protein
MPDEEPVRDDESVELERENNERDEEDPPPCPEEDERPDRQGSPELGVAEIAEPGADDALQSLRGVSA